MLQRLYRRNLLFILFLIMPYCTLGQDNLEVHFAPNLISKPKVYNSSEASIYGGTLISFDAGINYSHMLTPKLGYRVGLDIGIVDWNYNIEAPRNAFGTGEGEGILKSNSNSENYFYNALSTELVFKGKWGKASFAYYLGPSIRYYHQEMDPSIIAGIYNRDKPSFEQPSPETSDVWIEIPRAGERIHVNITTGIGIEKRLSSRSNLVLGVRKNWGIDPIGKGSLMVKMYDKIYHGNFSPRSNYIGLDLRFNYELANRSKNFSSRPPLIALVDSGKFRKTLFMDFLGNGGCLTGNFDMRLNPDRNDGLGIRAGLGSGYLYFTGTKIHRYISVPLGLNYIVGKRRSGLESGIGVTTQFAPRKVIDDPKVFAETYLNLGYRFQPLRNDLMFRVMWTPYFYKSGVVADWGGVSLGYSFK